MNVTQPSPTEFQWFPLFLAWEENFVSDRLKFGQVTTLPADINAYILKQSPPCLKATTTSKGVKKGIAV